MTHTFVIYGRLPSLNDYIHACNRAWYIGESFKKKAMNQVSTWIIAARLPRITVPVIAYFVWYEPNRRRDRDNIRSAEKYIMDALVNTNRIVKDSQKWVLDSKHTIELDPKNPRVEVTLEELA